LEIINRKERNKQGRFIKCHKTNVGLKFSKERSDNLSKARLGIHPWNWKGGQTPFNKRIYYSYKYRQWHSDVFTRDNFTCQECGSKKEIQTHHIISFASIIKSNVIKTYEEAMECEELWNINNGVTLCKECHDKITHIRKNKR